MKQLLPFILLLCCLSCLNNSDNWTRICDVENYIESRPDSALSVLSSIDKDVLTSEKEKAKYAMFSSMALDKNYIDKTDFEILQPAIEYYDRHGSPTDKLRTFYYQGRIYQNRGEDKKAMECFVKSIDFGRESNDLLTKARIYRAQSSLYYQYYNWGKIIETSLAAAEYYKTTNNIDNYVLMLCRAAECFSILEDYESAQQYLSKCYDYLNMASDRCKSYYYAIYMSHNFKDLSNDDIQNIISKYIGLAPESEINWIAIASAYLKLGQVTLAKEALCNINLVKGNAARYYAILTQILKTEGLYEEALESYEKYNKITDSLDFISLKQDTQFIEERHQLEMKRIREEEKRNKIIYLLVFIILLFTIISIGISSRLRLSKMEKLIIQKEIESYKYRYSQIEEERDNLNALLNESKELSPEALNTVGRRLELLNKFFTASITDNIDIDRRANKEMEDLLNNKNEFMDSTRLAFAGSHPKFIKYLKDKGLTEWEINYCCLYALGLNGKEVGAYIKLRSHYNNSSEIREKLGINEHDTNLGIYIRKLVKHYSE